MKSRTPKRAKEEEEYARICDEIDAEEIELHGRLYCFFCGREVGQDKIHHHLKGREGRLLTDKRWIIIGHFTCHQEYHDLPIRKQKWRDGFLERLREKDLQTYYKEREKENK